MYLIYGIQYFLIMSIVEIIFILSSVHILKYILSYKVFTLLDLLTLFTIPFVYFLLTCLFVNEGNILSIFIKDIDFFCLNRPFPISYERVHSKSNMYMEIALSFVVLAVIIIIVYYFIKKTVLI